MTYDAVNDSRQTVPRVLVHGASTRGNNARTFGWTRLADGNGRRNMRLSYCLPPPERIREGVRRLAGVLEQQLDLVETFGPDAARHAAESDSARPTWMTGSGADQV